jgi:transposase InsO family protein
MEIVGWSMSERLKSTLCEDALTMAIRNRRPPKALIHHADRGVQYACGDYRKLLCQPALKRDPLLECAPAVGQDQAAVLTGARALRFSNWMGLR